MPTWQRPAWLGGGKQAGGPVEAGRPVVVGEAGAELFVPSQAGRIVPHALYGAALAAEYGLGVRGASTAMSGALRGAGGGSIGQVMTGGIPGAGLLRRDEDRRRERPSAAHPVARHVGPRGSGRAGALAVRRAMASERQRRARRGRDARQHRRGRRKHRAAIQSGRATDRFEQLAEKAARARRRRRRRRRGANHASELRRRRPADAALAAAAAGAPVEPSAAAGPAAAPARREVLAAAGAAQAPERSSAAAAAGQAGTGSGKAAADAYLGRAISAGEYDSLMRATHAESGARNSPEEQAMIMGTILNRARTHPGGITGALTAKNQFQAVTGTRFEPGPSAGIQTGARRSETRVDRERRPGFVASRADKPNQFHCGEPSGLWTGNERRLFVAASGNGRGGLRRDEFGGRLAPAGHGRHGS